MIKPILYMMIGVPGSGKTTYAQTYLQNDDTIIVNSDKIREELYGDEMVQKDPKKVFEILYARARHLLQNGKNVVIDATNTSRKYRKVTLANFTDIECEKIAVLVDTPIEMCYKFDERRERHVSRRVIDRYAREMEKPMLDEGFDKIIVYKNE